MSSSGNESRDGFTSRFGIICAAAGSAIGLGNIWRFPYIVGESGGGAFLLIYLGFILLLGIPVMLSEFVIGRRGQRNALGSFKRLAPGTPWYLVGVMGIVAAFMILAFYSTIAGWTLAYVVRSVSNAFAGMTSQEISESFGAFHTTTFWPLFYQLVFMVMTAWIILSGVKKGIERYAKILMPFLVLLLVIMAIRAVTLPGASVGLSFLFKPDFSAVDSSVLLAALGQAFFSLSIGMGALITYGSYIQKNNNLSNISIQVTLADTMIAILAGVAIFPAVFAFGLDPADGPGLIYTVLPNIFQQMPGGYFFAIVFFVLLAIAALTSSISILEVVVAYLTEELNVTRRQATVMAASAATLVGVLCTLSFGVMEGFTISGLTIFDLLDFTASNVLLPFGGLLIVVFVSWYMKQGDVWDELSNGGALKVHLFNALMFILKFIAPVASAIVLLESLVII